MLLLAALTSAAPLTLDVTSSKLGFTVGSTLEEVTGNAGVFTGTIDPEARAGRLQVTAAALRTGLGPRDARLLAYALEVTRFPSITYTVTDARGLAPKGGGEAILRGSVTIRDVTRPLDVPVHYGWEGTSLRLSGRVELSWADFGVPDPSVLVATVSPQVTVSFEVVARAPGTPDATPAADPAAPAG